MKNLFLAIVLCVGLTGCSTIEAVLHPSQYLVLNLASQLTTAEDSAEIYVFLPYCDKSPVGTSCKDRALVRKLKTYDNAAWTAIHTADHTKSQSDVAAAQSAVDAYKSIVAIVSK